MHSAGWQLRQGPGPIVAVALHDGHVVRDEVRPLLALDEKERLPLEDPYTRWWTSVAQQRVVALHSRFEVDFDSPREQSVAASPGNRWVEPPPDEVVGRSLALYDGFYERVEQMLADVAAEHGRFCVLDIHSHPAANGPEPAVEVSSADRDRWSSLVERFVDDLAGDVCGLQVTERSCDDRGRFAAWVAERFGDQGCCLRVDFAETYLDGGKPVEDHLDDLVDALAGTIPGLEKELAPR